MTTIQPVVKIYKPLYFQTTKLSKVARCQNLIKIYKVCLLPASTCPISPKLLSFDITLHRRKFGYNESYILAVTFDCYSANL